MEEKQTPNNRRRAHFSGISGQPVLEGVMMRNRDLLAVAVRKPDQVIEIEVDEHHDILEGSFWSKIPMIRGIFALVDLLMLGYRSMNFAASFYDETARQNKAAGQDPSRKSRGLAVIRVLTGIAAAILAVGLFVLLPSYFVSLIEGYVRSSAFLEIVEAIIRLVIFLVYVLIILNMKDVRRIRQYHGAEHKCINCIERGKPLTPHYVRDSSRYYKGCGSGFLFAVLLICALLFFFIHIDSRSLRLLVRIAIVPLTAGVCYEIFRWAGQSESLAARILSTPVIWLQKLLIREPDAQMIQVGIASVEAVFDWRAFLADEFGYDREELNEY